VTRTDANLHATGLVYDEFDRMTAKVYPGGYLLALRPTEPRGGDPEPTVLNRMR
jgi:YD repeat-containing protein